MIKKLEKFEIKPAAAPSGPNSDPTAAPAAAPAAALVAPRPTVPKADAVSSGFIMPTHG